MATPTPRLEPITVKPAAPPPIPPRASPGDVDAWARNAAANAPTKRGVLTWCIASLAAMLPWPLLAILATHGYFDRANEAILLFGGITGIPLAILSVVGLSETTMLAVILVVWIAAAIVPALWLWRGRASGQTALIVLALQSAFSLAQAGMGALMIYGKAC